MSLLIDLFTVVCLHVVTWSFNESEADVDLPPFR